MRSTTLRHRLQAAHPDERPRPPPASSREPDDLRVMARMDRGGAGIDQEDDVGLEPLGAVHGHHADLVAERFGVALDVGLGRVEPVEEALQRRNADFS